MATITGMFTNTAIHLSMIQRVITAYTTVTVTTDMDMATGTEVMSTGTTACGM
jgi:hypothetical protein